MIKFRKNRKKQIVRKTKKQTAKQKNKTSNINDFSAFGKRVTVTSALPYINGVKHLGNLVGSLLPADVFHRFLDLFNVPNIYVCGTDEHGTPAEVAALKDNLSVREYCSKYYQIQKDIYEKWSFDFTNFGRTSSVQNRKLTQAIFLGIKKNGFIKEQTIVTPFCPKCNKFLPDRFVEGTCPQCGYATARGDQCESCGRLLNPEELKAPYCNLCKNRELEFRHEKHLFLDFTKLEPKLKSWILQNKHWPTNTRNFALGWIKEGLRPRCITRNLEWGVPVPLKGYEHLVFYVWFDAPIGYVSITQEWCDSRRKSGEWGKWWNAESRIYHFLGKDNIPFHTVFWPGVLMASNQGIALPYYVAGYEYLNWEGSKFSTSKSHGLFSDDALELYPVDYWRFYLLNILPESKDSNFSWKDFQSCINNELIANYGNLFYRVTSFIHANYNGAVPKPGALGPAEKELQKELDKTLHNVKKSVEEVKLREALKHIMALSSSLNKYFQEQKPWKLVKGKPEEQERCRTVLYTSANTLRSITELLIPYIPHSCNTALGSLNTERTKWSNLADFQLKPEHGLGKSVILFKKIEDKELDDIDERIKSIVIVKNKEKMHAKKGGIKMGEKSADAGASQISFAEFQRLDLRVGTIVDVKDHPNADKLILMTVDMGSEKRQIVAGIKQYYKKEQLKGKQIVVAANLEPVVLRGEKSHGMLLAADDEAHGIVSILEPDQKVPNGIRVR